MKKLFKGLSIGFVALALVMSMGVGSANAVLTFSSVAVDSAAGDAMTIGASNVAGTIAIGVANTGGITIGNGATVKTISVGAGNAVNTIKIGDHATPVNVITIGGAASSLALTDAQWSITTAGLITTAGVADGTDTLVLTAGDILVTDGDIDLSSGALTVTETANTATVNVINNTATTLGVSTGIGIAEIQSTSLTTGTLLNLELTEGTLAGGWYLKAWDITAGAAVFAVAENGATTIAGAAEGTAALTLTAGDIVITDGDLTLTAGDATFNETVTVTAGGSLASSVANVIAPFMPTVAQQALSGAGAVNITTYYTAVTNTGADALTLADSTVTGQLKKVKMIVDPGTDSTLSFNAASTIVFADIGDYAVLMWNGSDWIAVEIGNDADGATAPVYTP